MHWRHPRAATAGIWALVLIFAIIQVVAGTLGGDASLRPIVMLRIFSAWVAVFTLAIISTRRIGGLARTIVQQEHARTATLDQVEQLEMSNAILQILARSVDVPLAF